MFPVRKFITLLQVNQKATNQLMRVRRGVLLFFFCSTAAVFLQSHAEFLLVVSICYARGKTMGEKFDTFHVVHICIQIHVAGSLQFKILDRLWVAADPPPPPRSNEIFWRVAMSGEGGGVGKGCHTRGNLILSSQLWMIP